VVFVITTFSPHLSHTLIPAGFHSFFPAYHISFCDCNLNLSLGFWLRLFPTRSHLSLLGVFPHGPLEVFNCFFLYRYRPYNSLFLELLPNGHSIHSLPSYRYQTIFIFQIPSSYLRSYSSAFPRCAPFTYTIYSISSGFLFNEGSVGILGGPRPVPALSGKSSPYVANPGLPRRQI
jgi:hypothetical protein